jgi:hypothetical protein
LGERPEVPIEPQSNVLRPNPAVEPQAPAKQRPAREGGLEIPDFLRRK